MTDLPQLRVESVRKIYDDGHHNAFTDLCRFKGRIYLTCRSCPDGHMVFTSSSIVVLVSDDDGATWEKVFSFDAPPDRDTRDPHFLIFRDQLFVYTGTWLVPPEGEQRDLNDHLGYAAWTADGVSWNGPRSLEGTYGHYIWRAAAHGDKAYLCARRRRDFPPGYDGEDGHKIVEGAMLESDDGLIWRYCTLFTEDYGDETAFLFEPDGSVLAIARGLGPCTARVCRSAPPYDAWIRTDLDRNVGGPLLAQWGDRYLVAGRKSLEPNKPRTTLYWLVDDQLCEIAELPSDGDNSYPGLLPLDDRRALLSYYSSHEETTSIYLAELELT